MSRCTKVESLRTKLQRYGVDAYVIPSEDSHQSEYPLEADRRRAYISGFTGSAGVVLVTNKEAHLWTDGRYHLQAEKQLEKTVWTLNKQGTPQCPKLSEVIKKSSKRVGFDPFVHTQKWVDAMLEQLTPAGVALVPIHQGSVAISEEEAKAAQAEAAEATPAYQVAVAEGNTEAVASTEGGVGCSSKKELEGIAHIEKGQMNLVDAVWEEDGENHRPEYPCSRIANLEKNGQSVEAKLKLLHEAVRKANKDILLLAKLDQIAWLFNIRGLDVDCSRVFLAYAMVPAAEGSPSHIFIKWNSRPQERYGANVVQLLKKAGVELHEYDEFAKVLTEQMTTHNLKRVWVDQDVNVGVLLIAKALSQEQPVLYSSSPVDLWKATKNPVELAGMRDTHVQDGLALTVWLAWLHTRAPAELRNYTECTAGDVLQQCRASRPGFVALSFETIAGVDANGAIIHYKPEPESCAAINPEGMFLVDSGAHFDTGTTDVTRTVFLGGNPSDLQKEMYTRVLMGHLDIAAAVFPEGTYGCVLDSFARRYLWQIGFDYMHGTGHGVGHSLEVHESPPCISFVCPPSSRDTPFKPGMVVSNEPGAYLDGKFGIRIESLVYCRQVDTPFNFNGKSYLGFENLTLVPYCKQLIKKELLNKDQLDNLNTYHTHVNHVIGSAYANSKHPFPIDDQLSPDAFMRWLNNATSPL